MVYDAIHEIYTLNWILDLDVHCLFTIPNQWKRYENSFSKFNVKQLSETLEIIYIKQKEVTTNVSILCETTMSKCIFQKSTSQSKYFFPPNLAIWPNVHWHGCSHLCSTHHNRCIAAQNCIRRCKLLWKWRSCVSLGFLSFIEEFGFPHVMINSFRLSRSGEETTLQRIIQCQLQFI